MPVSLSHDDPLSAVDQHVAKRLFERCLSGILEGVTRVLVTHQIQYLDHPSVSKVIVMKLVRTSSAHDAQMADLSVCCDQGQVAAQGSYVDMQAQGWLNTIKAEEEEHRFRAGRRIHPPDTRTGCLLPLPLRRVRTTNLPQAFTVTANRNTYEMHAGDQPNGSRCSVSPTQHKLFGACFVAFRRE